MQIKFDDFITIIISFEEVCEEKLGYVIPKESGFYKLVDMTLELYSRYKNEKKNLPWHDPREEYTKVFGFIDLLLKLISVCEHESFLKLKDHIELLGTDAEIVQNFVSRVTDQETNKIFELYIASACLRFADDIDLDHPKHSSGGENPDVIIKYNGISWGIACKMVHTNNFKTYAESYLKGISQLENSSIDHGFVMFNMKNLDVYDYLWPIVDKDEESKEYILAGYFNFQQPLRRMNKLNDQYYENVGPHLSQDYESRTDLFGKKTIPILVNYFTCVCGMYDLSKPFIRRLYSMPVIELDTKAEVFQEFIKPFDKALQDAM